VLLASARIALDGFYYCPHHPGGTVPRYAAACLCRKPRAGLLEQASRELDLNLRESFMVGDILDDVEAGHRAGCRSVLVDNGNETVWRRGPHRNPDIVARDVLDAAVQILALEPARVAKAAGSPSPVEVE
jgi:histidinol phosphatase-like enzyme